VQGTWPFAAFVLHAAVADSYDGTGLKVHTSIPKLIVQIVKLNWIISIDLIKLLIF
jgi:hypothetical protein